VKFLVSIFIFFYSAVISFSQPNCQVMKNDLACHTACEKAWAAIKYKQGSYKSQQLFDESIELCPTFAYSYMQKAVPYLKRGLFIEWKRLIDKAVELSPLEYLGYRGWCRIQFLRDYYGAIKDLEQLKNISKGDIGFCQNGNYHLEVALALCYKELDQHNKAKSILIEYLESERYSEAIYDFHHLGVIEYELGDLDAARSSLEKQIKVNEIAESHYYLALIARKKNKPETFDYHKKQAEEKYKQEFYLYDNYCEPIDKIYLSDILELK